jgi:predicted nuclease of restriction endonuclease-like RecB superfamily
VLTREHAIAEYRAGQIAPDRLTQKAHQQYLGYAERMLRVYGFGIGRTRRELHRAVAGILSTEEDCPTRRIEAFCKLLDDASAFRRDNRGKAAALRREVFRMAAPRHPLVRRADRLFEHEESTVKRQIASQIGLPWKELEDRLFADVIDFHRLERFDGYPDAAALLARYNVAQVQAALFQAVSMTVWADDDFTTILRYAKLARLMHTIRRMGDGRYCFRFDGPASMLRSTNRYGAAMARFFPALAACRAWRMHAVIRTRGGHTAALDLSSADGLRSHLPPPDDFDSTVEQAFAESWGDEPRDGWRLIREGEILHQGQKVFVPDFVLRHEDGRSVLLEIVGYWTPEYLQSKAQTLETFRDHRILLAVAARLRDEIPLLPTPVVLYKTKLKVADVIERLAVSD